LSGGAGPGACFAEPGSAKFQSWNLPTDEEGESDRQPEPAGGTELGMSVRQFRIPSGASLLIPPETTGGPSPDACRNSRGQPLHGPFCHCTRRLELHIH
jgi:hypothetical protein